MASTPMAKVSVSQRISAVISKYAFYEKIVVRIY